MEPTRTYSEDGSVETYYEDGSLRHVQWRVNGEYHRVDGPAYIWYYKNGSIGSEHWFVDDEYHRIDGPAIILYNEYGLIEDAQWWVNNIFINDDIIPWLEENNITAPFSEADQVAIKLRWS